MADQPCWLSASCSRPGDSCGPFARGYTHLRLTHRTWGSQNSLVEMLFLQAGPSGPVPGTGCTGGHPGTPWRPGHSCRGLRPGSGTLIPTMKTCAHQLGTGPRLGNRRNCQGGDTRGPCPELGWRPRPARRKMRRMLPEKNKKRG